MYTGGGGQVHPTAILWLALTSEKVYDPEAGTVARAVPSTFTWLTEHPFNPLKVKVLSSPSVTVEVPGEMAQFEVRVEAVIVYLGGGGGGGNVQVHPTAIV